MNLSAIILGFVGMALLAGMFVFITATQTATVTDSYGNLSTSAGNATDLIVQNVTSVGTQGTGFMVMVLAALGIVGALGMLMVYSKTK